MVFLVQLIFLVTPVMDELACGFCGPTAESTATASVVPHSEDHCILNDGFVKRPSVPDGEPTHVHFCLLHSTTVLLSEGIGVAFNLVTEREVNSAQSGYRSPDLPTPFHPPVFS